MERLNEDISKNCDEMCTNLVENFWSFAKIRQLPSEIIYTLKHIAKVVSQPSLYFNQSNVNQTIVENDNITNTIYNQTNFQNESSYNLLIIYISIFILLFSIFFVILDIFCKFMKRRK